jgi:glycosyltransferase involved in cell wall biosynthesis
MKTSSDPVVTVLMPVYNGEKYLREAIDSLLNQVFTGFEFLIINDGSKDKSVEIITSYDDKRVRLVHNEQNMGIAKALNKGMSLARGLYMARADCDDVSVKNRLGDQVAYLDANKNIDICNTWIEVFDEEKIRGVVKYPLIDSDIKSMMFFDSPIAHPTVMMRRNSVRRAALSYDSSFEPADDYDLFARAAEAGLVFGCIPKVLLRYRVISTSLSRAYWSKQQTGAGRVRRHLAERLGLTLDADSAALHNAFLTGTFDVKMHSFRQLLTWVNTLHMANRRNHLYGEPLFSELLADRLFRICYGLPSDRFAGLTGYFFSEVSKYKRLPIAVQLKFLIKALLPRTLLKVIS